MAATVIIYTACWYVNINEMKEEKHKASEQLYLCNKDEAQEFYHSKFDKLKENVEDNFNEYRVKEPIRIVRTNYDGKTYRICYYSTELKAQTAYQRYENRYIDATIDGNIITFLCK